MRLVSCTILITGSILLLSGCTRGPDRGHGPAEGSSVKNEVLRITERTVIHRTLREVHGPVTAHEAWAFARPIARELDPDARLSLLASGPDINARGRSWTWDFGFELPLRQGYALLSIEPSREGDVIDEAPLVLVQRLRPVAASELGRKPALPDSFRDSPEAVAALTARGANFVSGPSEMTLSARVLPSGDAAWITLYWDEEYSVPFAAP